MKKQVLLSDINRRECKWQSILPILESMNYILGEYYHICDVVEIETQDGIDFDTIKCIGKPEEIKTISLGWGDPMVTSDYGYITLFSNGKVTLSWYDNVTQKGEDFEWASLIDAYKLGVYVMHLGAGRKNKEDKIDYSVGVILKKEVGEYINIDDILMTVYTNKELEYVDNTIFEITNSYDNNIKLIYEVIK